jgi:hypothetical protein
MDVVTPSEGGEQYLCHSERTGGILELALGAFSFGKSMESLYPGICYHIPGVQSFLNARTWWHWRGHKDRHRDALALIDGIESMYVRVDEVLDWRLSVEIVRDLEQAYRIFSV